MSPLITSQPAPATVTTAAASGTFGTAVTMTALAPPHVVSALQAALAHVGLTTQATSLDARSDPRRSVATDLFVWTDDEGAAAPVVRATIHEVVDEVRRCFPDAVISHDLAR